MTLPLLKTEQSVFEIGEGIRQETASVIRVGVRPTSLHSFGEGGGVARLRLPRRAAVFPMVVGELFYMSAVKYPLSAA